MAPRGRSFEDFKKESQSHGWPSFRDNEVMTPKCMQRKYGFENVDMEYTEKNSIVLCL